MNRSEVIEYFINKYKCFSSEDMMRLKKILDRKEKENDTNR